MAKQRVWVMYVFHVRTRVRAVTLPCYVQTTAEMSLWSRATVSSKCINHHHFTPMIPQGMRQFCVVNLSVSFFSMNDELLISRFSGFFLSNTNLAKCQLIFSKKVDFQSCHFL